MLQGAEVVFGSVKDKESIREKAFAGKVDVVVSCLASRTGGIKDSWEIDYEATKNVMVPLPLSSHAALSLRSGGLSLCCPVSLLLWLLVLVLVLWVLQRWGGPLAAAVVVVSVDPLDCVCDVFLSRVRQRG